jgi:Predicted transcriptional regulator
MKIDRLIGIITILLQNEKVTAPYLADKFEVSRRTINRDIEDICKAGIPIVTMQGTNGGITIAQGYKIDKAIFTEKDLKAIFSGLSSLNSIAQDNRYQKIIDKFFKKNGLYAGSHILVDLSSHYKNSLAPKIEELQHSIEEACEVEFTYYNTNGEHKVILDPYLIVFQWSSWYLFGFNHASAEFRLYKLNRLWDLKDTGKQYTLQDIPPEKQDFGRYFTNEIQAVILFDESVKYRLVEDYGRDCYTISSDGRLCLKIPFTNKDYMLDFILSFGEKAELVEPHELREELKNRLQKTFNQYSPT